MTEMIKKSNFNTIASSIAILIDFVKKKSKVIPADYKGAFIREDRSMNKFWSPIETCKQTTILQCLKT